MRFLRPILAIGANALGLWLASTYLSGFVLDGTWTDLAIIAVALTALNFFLKPVLKLLLGPVIILTFGLGLILVNALMLYILDFFFENLTIQVVPDLFYAAILIGFINFIVHFATS